MTRISSGTFPVSRGYLLRQMLFNPWSGSEGTNSGGSADFKVHARCMMDQSGIAHPGDGPEQTLPSFPFGDVPIYADTVHLESEYTFGVSLPRMTDVASGER